MAVHTSEKFMSHIFILILKIGLTNNICYALKKLEFPVFSVLFLYKKNGQILLSTLYVIKCEYDFCL